MSVKNIFTSVKNTYKNRKFDILCHYAILLYWEVAIYAALHSSLKGFTGWNALFILPIAFVISSIVSWSSKRIDDDLHILILEIICIFYIGDYIYYKSSGSLLSVSIMGVGKDAITNFWWSLRTILIENIFSIIMFEIPVIVMAILFIQKKNKLPYYKFHEHVVLFITGVVVWFFIVLMLPLGGRADYTAYGAYHSRYIDTDTASRKIGVLPNFLVEARYYVFGGSKNTHVLQTSEDVIIDEVEEVTEKVEYHKYDNLDFKKLAELSEDEQLTLLCEYLDSTSYDNKNQYTGLFEGYNLIYICAESFSSLAIDEEITPTLYEMANNGIVLNNYYNSFKNVTTNGEYAFLTGLWPDVARQETNMGKITGTMGQSMDKDMSMAIGNMFNESEHIQSRGYHNYLGFYYGRNETLPNMGFDCKFMNDGMTFTTSWPASDYEMMEQSVDDYINDSRFMTYYMTFSGHGNYTTDNIMVYRNYNYVSSIMGYSYPTSAVGYLSCNYELEKGMAYLIERLKEAGKLDNTVIVLTGDHYPYYLTNAGYEALRGETYDEDFGAFKSTCIIYNAGLSEKIEVDTPCCNVDILPTILNLFNIDYDSRLYAGTDIFSGGTHLAQLYNKNFITDYVKYNYATG